MTNDAHRPESEHRAGPRGARLGRSSAFYRLLLENAPFGCIVASTRQNGRCHYVNPEFTRVTGYDLTDIPTVVHWLLKAYPDPDYREKIIANWPRDVDPANMGRDVIYRVHCKDGARKQILLRAGMVEPEVMFVMALDVTDRIHAEEALKAKQAQIDAAIESMPFDFFALDAEGRYTLVNSVARGHWGNIAGKAPDELDVDPAALAVWKENNRRALAGETVRGEVNYSVRGEPRCIYNVLNPIRVDGRVTGIVGVNVDITDLKEAERERSAMAERLRHSEKMEAIGQLAGGVAHDFNNLLSVIQGNAELLDDELRDRGDAAARERVAPLLQAAARAAELTRQLLTFARRQPLRLAPVDVHAGIREVAGLLERVIDKRIELHCACAAARPVVEADAAQLQMALLNLALNARDAMPEGGAMTLATRNVQLHERDAARYHCETLVPGEYVEISVSDTGHGMDAATLRRIFEPFFTTKSDGGGTGLGLASVYGAVRSHGGGVHVASEVGKGSTFALVLPVWHGAEAVQAPSEDLPPAPRGGQALVVDDEALIRDLAVALLRRLGYRTIACGGGAEAIAVFERRHAEIDVVLLDLVMPRPAGAEVFHALRQIAPRARIVLVSGNARDEAAEALLATGGAAYLEKPFHLQQLSRALTDVQAVRGP